MKRIYSDSTENNIGSLLDITKNKRSKNTSDSAEEISSKVLKESVVEENKQSQMLQEKILSALLDVPSTLHKR
jgi:hypothetical protein